MSYEQDKAVSTNSVTEPPKKTGFSRIKYLRRITSSKPLEYASALGAYARAPQMLGEDFIGAAKHLGDRSETLEVNIQTPQWWLDTKEPIRKGDELFLPRPEQEEAIYVGVESSSPSTTLEELISQPPQQPTTITPPYKQEWKVIEGGLVTEPRPAEQPVNNPPVPDNLRFIRPLTQKELEEAA